MLIFLKRIHNLVNMFRLTRDELENLESTESDVEQRRILEQVVIDKDLPVAMRTIQVIKTRIYL